MKNKIFISFCILILSCLKLAGFDNNHFNIELFMKNHVSTSQMKNFNKNNLNFLFWIKKNSCYQCVIVAVNHYNTKIKSLNLKSNIITILETDKDDIEDNNVFKTKFNTSYFILDHDDNFRQLDSNYNSISNMFLIIDSVGNILYKKINFNVNPIDDLDSLLKLNKTKIKNLVLAKTVKLVENDTIILSNISKPYLNKDFNYLIFCDFTLNKILKYSIQNGTLVDCVMPPMEYKYHFANLNDSIENVVWTGFDIDDNAFVSFKDFMVLKNDTIVLIELFNKVENVTKEKDKRPAWAFYRGIYPFIFSNDKFNMFNNECLYKKIDSLFLYNFNVYSDSELLCKSINPFTEDTLGSFYIKAPYEFIKFDLNNWTKTPFLKYTTFNKDYNEHFFYPNIKKYATNGYNELIALDWFSKKGKLFRSDSLISEIHSSDILTKYFNSEKNISLLDIVLTKHDILIVFSISSASTSDFILEIYNFNGELIYQGKYQSDDQLLESNILDYSNKEIKLLNKWRNKRWTFQQYELEY